MKVINYDDLNARQKELYNFQKASAIFADYGFATIKLSDDWLGADFIAMSFDGKKQLKVQLKGRLSFDKKYLSKDIFICFNDKKLGGWYLYPHDQLLKVFMKKIGDSKSWSKHGSYSFPGLSEFSQSQLASYKL